MTNKFENMSDEELSGAMMVAIHGEDINHWCLSDCRKFAYHCGTDGSGYYEVDIIDINNHDHMWPIMERCGMVLTIDGTVCIPKYKIKHRCESKILRAAAIVFLMMQESINV